ncbi:MAG TPA: HAD-IA family hydrolase [Methylocella sp.]|nr:HAD-IA family hydrolase [Methylocella sp.]
MPALPPMPFAMPQRPPPPLLVFDLDGTLAETAGDLVATLNVILAREGLAGIDLAEARPMVGGGARLLIQRGLSAHGIKVSDARLDTMLADFLAYYEEHIADETTLFPGVAAALERFEAAGFAFAVCTNKLEHSSVLLLTALGIAGRFRAICGKDTFPISKPNGEVLLQTIARAGGDRRRTVMIGDSKTDIDTARNARVPVIAVNFGYTSEPVDMFKPDRVIGHYGELWDAVEALGVA